MEYAKKFALVPEDSLNKHTPSPQQLSEIDRQLLKILNNRQLNDTEKVKLYYAILQNKLNLEEHNPPHVETKPSVDYASLILESTPQRVRKHVNNLLAILKQNAKVFKWNELGEIVIRDQTLTHSNIVDLVNMLFNNSSKKLPGQELFLTTLKELNIPQNYIRNRNLQEPKKKKSRITKPTPKWLKL